MLTPYTHRYDDGEVTRYGAGESYRPFNSNRSPRRARSPPPRERARTPPLENDRYIPNNRRRSRSPDRYRRNLSRERRDTGDSWRRDDRPRRNSPPRRSPPRRSPVRRSPPRRFSPPRRDDRDRDARDNRDRGRVRSPRRGFDPRLLTPAQFTNPNTIPLTHPRRPRSRSFDRERNGRSRSPPRPSPAPIQRASTYRGRSRSAERRDDRYVNSYNRRPSPPRDSAISSAIPSRDTSRRPSPHGGPPRREDRSRPQSPVPSRPLSRSSFGGPTRDRSPQRTPLEPANASARSPPRGPAALRPPPTGPRDSRGYGNQSANAIGPPPRPGPASNAAPNRHDTWSAPTPSPTMGRQEVSTSPGAVPPSGPRNHFSSRGGGYNRGGRGGGTLGGWGATIQSRNLPLTTGPASASPGMTSSGIPPPTGPRGSISSHSVPSTPVSHSQQQQQQQLSSSSSKPFDPPKGPAADKNKQQQQQPPQPPSFAQQLLASMPPLLLPGGKIDPAQLAMDTGVLPELQAHTQRLKEEEERIREEKYVKEERLRRSLAEWDRMERESKVMELRDQLAEQSLKKISGEGTGGAAF